MQNRLRLAVIGTGALGKEHSRLYAALAVENQIEFSGVHDTDTARGKEIADRHGTRCFKSLDELVEHSDAVSVVTPTHTHFQIAHTCLERGLHVLVEKPMTDCPEHAEALVNLARSKGLRLQVGHVERFNPVFHYLQQIASAPRFIEGHRLSPYPKRSTDIGVVLDLMIHDLDIILAFVRSPVEKVDAIGLSVLSTTEDIANARIKFVNGCVANLTASRVSPDRMRKIRVFSQAPLPSYISLDYRAQEGYIYRLTDDDARASSLLTKLIKARTEAVTSEFGGKKIVREPVPLEKKEPLRLELESFVACITGNSEPVVSGASAKESLDLALEITQQIRDSMATAP